MKSKLFQLIFVCLCFMLLLAFTRTFKEDFVTPDTEYEDWKNELTNHASEILSAKVDYDAINAHKIDHSIDDEKQKYNDTLCQKYVRLFKLDPNPVMDYNTRKARLPVNYKNATAYDPILKRCVNTDDSSFQLTFECPDYIDCPNGGVSSSPGKKVMYNHNATCEYDCV